MAFNAYNATIEHYAPNSMAEWIHGWPRRDLSNSEGESDFDPENMKYWEAIGVVAMPFLLAGLLTITFFLARCLCNCCCWVCRKACRKTPKLKPPKKRPTITVWVFRITCLLVVGALIYGYVANELIREGIFSIRTSINDMDDLKDENILAINAMINEVDQIVAAAEALNGTLAAVNGSVPGGIPASVSSALDMVLSEFGSTSDTMRDGVNSLGDIPISDATDVIGMVEYYRYYGQLGILLFITVPFFVVFLAFLCKCRRVLWNVTWIGVLCSTLAWLLSALETSGCLVMADLCIEPSEYLLDQARNLDATAFDYAEFYIVCENITNPLNSELDSARTAVNDASTEVDTLDAFVDTLSGFGIPTEDVELISAQMANITTAADNILTTADFLIDTLFLCNRIHNNYIRSLDGICNHTVSGMFGLVIVQTALAVMTWVTIYCAVVMYRYLLDQLRQKKAGAEGDVDSAEVFAALASPRYDDPPTPSNPAKAIYP